MLSGAQSREAYRKAFQQLIAIKQRSNILDLSICFSIFSTLQVPENL